MKSINVHTRHVNRQSYETITVMCQFCEFSATPQILIGIKSEKRARNANQKATK